MECSSMVNIAAFGPRDPGSNPGWFVVLNSNWKLSFQKWYNMYSSKYRTFAIGSILLGLNKYILKL